MKKYLLLTFLFLLTGGIINAQPTDLKLTAPKANDEYRVGRTVTISWDTLDTQSNRTFETTFEFKWAESQDGPWNLLPLAKNAKDFKDVDSKNSAKAAGKTITVLPRKNVVWLKMQIKGNENVNTIVGPINVTIPPPATADSTITGDITGTVTLSSTKIYKLKKVVYVQNGGVLRVEPGTVVLGDDEETSAICVNRGGKIYAKGNAAHPIVFTSGYSAGNRDRGDWGGILLMGNAETNLGEAAIEGGIADGSDVKVNGWYGKWNDVNNNQDSSGVLEYVRIEFAGIAESPDNELNGLTCGAVGSKTVIRNVQVSYGGDDSFEWFGGAVDAKYIIAYNGIDDDFDTDNGYSGRIQFGLSYRFKDIADQSNSESFESDNDSKASENQPFTRPIFSNMTCIGAVQDTSWSAGIGDNKYNSKFLAAAQIRRNSRMSLVNSVLVGWPAGLEFTNDNTVRAAGEDSILVRNNSFIGIKNNKFFYFGSGTSATDKVTTEWLSKTEYANEFINGSGNTGALANLTAAYPAELQDLNPMPTANAQYLNSASFANARLSDGFFEQVSYRGAFASDITKRWDLPWSEYDPVNKVYASSSVENQIEISNNISVSAKPNPASEKSVILYQLPEDTYVTINIYNQSGAVIKTVASNLFQTQGYYEFRFEASELADGVYFVSIVTPKYNAMQTVTVVK